MFHFLFIITVQHGAKVVITSNEGRNARVTNVFTLKIKSSQICQKQSNSQASEKFCSTLNLFLFSFLQVFEYL